MINAHNGKTLLSHMAFGADHSSSAWQHIHCCCCYLLLSSMRVVPHLQCLCNRQPSVLQLEKKKHRMECDDLEFRASLLSMIKEMPFIGLFADIKGQTK